MALVVRSKQPIYTYVLADATQLADKKKGGKKTSLVFFLSFSKVHLNCDGSRPAAPPGGREILFWTSVSVKAKRNVYIHRELLHNRASASKLTHLRTPDLRGATATAMIRPDREYSGLFMDMVTTASAGFARRPVEAIALSSQPVLPFNEAA